MNAETREFFLLMLSVCKRADTSLLQAYRQLRELLERLCRLFTSDENLQMTDLAARLTYLGNSKGLNYKLLNRLHTFRLTSNEVLNKRIKPDEDSFRRDWATVITLASILFDVKLPAELARLLPEEVHASKTRKKAVQYKRIRVCFQKSDENYLYVSPVDFVAEGYLRVRYNVPEVNDAFADIVPHLWRCAQLNLLDVTVDGDGILLPGFMVLEPDYLVDISSLAECYKDYGSHPANYMMNKLLPVENPLPLLVGNIANLFLDEWIHAHAEVDYITCMRKAFRMYPLELASCVELNDHSVEMEFFQKCQMHFEHIRQVVKEQFADPGYKLDKEDAVLEPSYICEALGVQGRLDYMQRDMHAFIEMKSGKADENRYSRKVAPRENNRVQMLLYMAVLEFSMGVSHFIQHPYLLYTRYPLLYPAGSSWAMVKRVIALRNHIVAGEFEVQFHNSIDYTAGVIDQINPFVLNVRGLSGVFWNDYLSPPIARFEKAFHSLSDLERRYFLALYNFITKELYTFKSGDADYEGHSGASSLWLSSLAEKCEAGEIFYDLRLVENHASDEYKAYVLLEMPDYGSDFHPNFRKGDVVVLYERNTDTDSVTNKMVFKGCIEALDSRQLKIRFRASQRNHSVLPASSLYAVEHDFMDVSFRSMYKGLYSFLEANADRRDLLLCQRKPRFDVSYAEKISQASDDFQRVALKAVAAEDCFLLVGPPGTGKTSRALKRMVELFYEQPSTQILLLAYTNRAVDEICKSVLSIRPGVAFIRIGSELSCDEAYRPYLLENVIADCSKRIEVRQCITSCRVFIGTVASVTAKPELFKLKQFDVAIVDEATQILEPQLLGILCRKSSEGGNAVGKFVLIGDHKQLPAVVMQNEIQTRVDDVALQGIGLRNLRDSFFERFYRRYASDGSWTVDMLCRQGRMNPEVALFPNEAFYEGKLLPVGLPHQQGNVELSGSYLSPVRNLLQLRVAFIAAKAERENTSGKTNLCEAQYVARLSAEIFHCHAEEFCDKTLGVITPYRSQIALIRNEMEKAGIPQLKEVMVDTVERFQGSERDIIIYSFCVNHVWQLHFLSNLTEENGRLIDRKLNVALTRARKQLFLTGDPDVLLSNPIYASLLKQIPLVQLPPL